MNCNLKIHLNLNFPWFIIISDIFQFQLKHSSHMYHHYSYSWVSPAHSVIALFSVGTLFCQQS